MYNITSFNDEGLELGKERYVMSYLYGLSDFWAYVFEDGSKANLLLEASSLSASDIYSKFLQLTSNISLEDIAVNVDSQIKLILLQDTDLVPNTVETYSLARLENEGSLLSSARFICNRPFLPTSTLEEEVHYHLDPVSKTIRFSQPLSQLGFPVRQLQTGQKQYALWAVDARIDKGLIYNTFAKLLKIDPQSSSDNYKNLVYGMYYLYTNGPNIELLIRGLNLILGIPLARSSESVIDIRYYSDTNNYVVITDLNSYVIPYSLVPDVQVGDSLVTSQELSSWVEVKDYIKDGDWWLNFKIPKKIMPDVPEGQTRYATAGSYADYLMKEYLSRHTFLVNIKTVNFKNLQTFTEIASVLKEIKPTYTNPFYIWTVPLDDEIIEINTDELDIGIKTVSCEPIVMNRQRFERGSEDPLGMGCPIFTRFCGPAWVDKDSGKDPYWNDTTYTFKDGIVEGFIRPYHRFRDSTITEDKWADTYSLRNNSNYRIPKSKMSFLRKGVAPVAFTGKQGTPKFGEFRNVFLYTTTTWDVANKFAVFNQEIPDSHWFILGAGSYSIDAINVHAINSFSNDGGGDLLKNNYDLLFFRNKEIQLPKNHPVYSYEMIRPSKDEIYPNDFFLFVHVDEYTIGVWWVTENQYFGGRPYIPVRETDDDLSVNVTGPVKRVMSKIGGPRYLVRGLGSPNAPGTYGDSLNADRPKTRGDTTPFTFKVTVK